jgi:hypothetical protein
LPEGTYTAKVTLTDTDPKISNKPTAVFTVTYTQIQGYTCVDNACSVDSSGGVSLPNCKAACNSGGGGGSGYACVNNACTTVSTGGVSLKDCKAACSGGGGGSQYSCVNNACVIVTSGGVSLPDCTAACSVGGSQYSCVNNACTVVTSGGVSKPDCTAACGQKCTGPSCQASCTPPLTATPPSIVIPESSNLSYSCNNVTQCQITGGGLSLIEPASDTVPVAPTSTTDYTLTCVNSNYIDDTVTSNARVTVTGSSLCEQNPNGAGCPGH